MKSPCHQLHSGGQGQILKGWTTHHDTMVNNPEFEQHLQAYVAFNKDIWSCFFTNQPFIIDPSNFCWGNTLVNKIIAYSTKSSCSLTQELASFLCSSHSACYTPYDSSNQPFWSMTKAQFSLLCLKCSHKDGHHAPHCEATSPSRPKQHWVTDYKNGNLFCVSDNKSICTQFNIDNCTITDSNHWTCQRRSSLWWRQQCKPYGLPTKLTTVPIMCIYTIW